MLDFNWIIGQASEHLEGKLIPTDRKYLHKFSATSKNSSFIEEQEKAEQKIENTDSTNYASSTQHDVKDVTAEDIGDEDPERKRKGKDGYGVKCKSVKQESAESHKVYPSTLYGLASGIYHNSVWFDDSSLVHDT